MGVLVLICIIQKYLQSYYFFGRRIVCAVRKPRFFGLKKMRELYILCFEAGLVSPIWRICSTNKNVPVKGFFTSRLLKNEEIICIFVFSG